MGLGLYPKPNILTMGKPEMDPKLGLENRPKSNASMDGPETHLPPSLFPLAPGFSTNSHLLAAAAATPPCRNSRQRAEADARPLPGASTYSSVLSIPAVQSAGIAVIWRSRLAARVERPPLPAAWRRCWGECRIRSRRRRRLGVSHCRSVTDRAAHAPSLVLMETMGRAKHVVGGKEEVDDRDGRGGLHVWAPCVQKGDFGSPWGDRCGKGSHTCMAPLHPKRKGRLCTEKKEFLLLGAHITNGIQEQRWP